VCCTGCIVLYDVPLHEGFAFVTISLQLAKNNGMVAITPSSWDSMLLTALSYSKRSHELPEFQQTNKPVVSAQSHSNSASQASPETPAVAASASVESTDVSTTSISTIIIATTAPVVLLSSNQPRKKKKQEQIDPSLFEVGKHKSIALDEMGLIIDKSIDPSIDNTPYERYIEVIPGSTKPGIKRDRRVVLRDAVFEPLMPLEGPSSGIVGMPKALIHAQSMLRKHPYFRYLVDNVRLDCLPPECRCLGALHRHCLVRRA
jgi:hypothetical protein